MCLQPTWTLFLFTHVFYNQAKLYIFLHMCFVTSLNVYIFLHMCFITSLNVYIFLHMCL